ncbi:unnamed protein product, partial [Hymenolepis diminuta]|uniref:Uncharacterized protein n=1 Tax=Hymenolepis diminuta TaxID=6216 RepID=A0A0R3SZB9_HYMDI
MTSKGPAWRILVGNRAAKFLRRRLCHWIVVQSLPSSPILRRFWSHQIPGGTEERTRDKKVVSLIGPS